MAEYGIIDKAELTALADRLRTRTGRTNTFHLTQQEQEDNNAMQSWFCRIPGTINATNFLMSGLYIGAPTKFDGSTITVTYTTISNKGVCSVKKETYTIDNWSSGDGKYITGSLLHGSQVTIEFNTSGLFNVALATSPTSAQITPTIYDKKITFYANGYGTGSHLVWITSKV